MTVKGFVRKGIGGLAVAVLFLLLLEGGARWLPLERWERDLPDGTYPLFVRGEGPRADRYVLNPHFQGIVPPVEFARIKPRGVRRIFILGGSSARGWPGPVQASCSGYLQRALDSVAPGQFEIINVAAMAYGSHRVLDLLQDVVTMEPDLVIVWSGNNEYVERNLLPPAAQSGWMQALQRRLHDSHLYRGVRLGLHVTVPSLFAASRGSDLTAFRSRPEGHWQFLSRTEELDQEVLTRYRANLRSMVQVIRDHGARAVLCTLPVNLSAWVPHDVEPQFSGADRGRTWASLQDAAVRAFDEGHYVQALRPLQEMVAMKPNFATAHYLLGECHRQLGNLAMAESEYKRARDLDHRPLRALGVFEQAIREVAGVEGAALADLERAFLKESGSTLMGLDLFYDYVHLNEAGNKLAARQMLPVIAAALDPSLNVAGLQNAIAGDDWLERNNVPHFEADYLLGLTYQNNGELQHAEQAFLRALAERPDHAETLGALALISEERGDLARAETLLRRVVEMVPASPRKFDLARLLFRRGAFDEATALATRELAEGDPNYELLLFLGDLAVARGQFKEALDYLRQAQPLAGNDPTPLQKLGDLYRRLGDEQSARNAYDQAARLRSLN